MQHSQKKRVLSLGNDYKTGQWCLLLILLLCLYPFLAKWKFAYGVPIFFVVLLAGKILCLEMTTSLVSTLFLWAPGFLVGGDFGFGEWEHFVFIYNQRGSSVLYISFCMIFVWRLKGVPIKVWRCFSLGCACVWGKGVGERSLLLQDWASDLCS